MPGIFITTAPVTPSVLSEMDRITQEWTLRAARGECSWICADCCVTFPEGMPDACAHGLQRCTGIIQRDKAEARAERDSQPPAPSTDNP